MTKSPPDAGAPAEASSLALQALDAQVRLLPYALAFFGLALPLFLFVAAFATNRAWLGLSLGLYALNWTLFYAAMDWLKRESSAGRDGVRRGRVQRVAGVLWGMAIAQTAWFSLGAGPVSELLLILCAGASAAVIFFSAPSLAALLVTGPLAAAGPVVALLSRAETRHTGLIALSGEALALAFALILNRHLRSVFALAVEREALIAEREAALARAEALARSKSDLVATLSHEIRNGLVGVSHLLASAVGTDGRSAPSREQLKASLAAARDLTQVLDATLDSEDAEAGRLPVLLAPFDAAGLARDIVRQTRPAAAAKGLELSVQVDEILLDGARGAALADAARTRQILGHLIANAVNYTVRGRVEVAVRRIAPDRIRFEVIDSGPGLSTEELALAFTPFARVERTGAGVSGAGLGLSFSRRLAGLMRGAVAAESAPGVGSRFWLDLPFDPDATARDAPVCAEGERALKVMIIADDALGAAMLRASLESLGHRVLHAQDGARALDLLGVGDVDLIMMDARLADPCAPSTARRLRARAAPGGIPPLVAVIGGDAAEAQALREAGVDAVLRKPATTAAVARILADAHATSPRRPKAQAGARRLAAAQPHVALQTS